MRLLYFTISIPVLFMSFFLLLLSSRLRREYQVVKVAIATHPQTEFENLLTYLLALAEDHRYKTHFGFDPIAIGRAMFRLVASGRIEGASTIEQQLVRTVTRKYRISSQRKIEEIIISSIISINNTKEDIAHTYLSLAYFGSNVIGYKSASTMLLTDGELNDCKVKHGAAIVSLLKRPKPTQRNELWSKRHKERTSHIIAKYSALTSRSNRSLCSLGRAKARPLA